MAQLHDLKRQLQEAWDRSDILDNISVDLAISANSLRDQLHRVARERDQEREKRMEAEDLLFDRYMDDYDWAYNELMSAVSSGYPNETRHETALRYIRERENQEHRASISNAELAQAAEELRDTYLEALENEEERDD